MKLHFLVRWILAGTMAPASLLSAEPFKWVTDSFEDFTKGTLSSSGQNLYISKDGTIRTIHRFDLNNDGFPDLFFGNTHDEQSAVAPVIATEEANGVLSQMDLPVFGSDRVRVADLNKDGIPDLIFSLTNDGLQSSWRKISIVYGGIDGWKSRRSNGALPVENPLDLAIVDLNADGWPDIATIDKPYNTGQSISPKNLRIYWGSKKGYGSPRFSDYESANARHLATADITGDGAMDLITLTPEGEVSFFLSTSDEQEEARVGAKLTLPPGDNYLGLAVSDFDRDRQNDLIATTDKHKAYFLRGKAGGKFGKPSEFDCFPASHISADDLDGDGYIDLVLTSLQTSIASLASSTAVGEDTPDSIKILWGGKDGFSQTQSLSLPAKFASATATGDVNGDGIPDIAVAILQGEKTYAANSLLYLGTPDRRFELSKGTVQTEGASDVAVIPKNKESPGKLIFSNKVKGTLYERIPAYVYWGARDGFNPENRLEIPGQSSHMASATDLNADGYTDLLVTFTAHGGEMALNNPNVGTNIFWGGPKGLDLENQKTILPTPWMDHCNVADLNKDGYLDIVLGGWTPWLGKDKGKPSELSIYYGSPEGFDHSKPVSIKSEGRSQGVVIADFNNDSWLDIVVTSYEKDLVRIFHGSQAGFIEENQAFISVEAPIAIETADFNGDEYLDLVVSRYMDRKNGLLNAGSSIFWGGPDGFKEWDSQWLPGLVTQDFSIADFDKNGFLDIFSANYHDQARRDQIPSFLFWGSSHGFLEDEKSSIICDSASGSFAGDFNEDGLIDLAISCHTKYGDHKTNSLVLYNDGMRFSQPKKQFLPTLGSHFMYRQDMGNIYNREPVETYESPILPLPRAFHEGQLKHTSEIPPEATLSFDIRAANKKSDLLQAAWRRIDGQSFELKETDRFLQYRAVFRSKNGDQYPLLEKVDITLD